MRPANLTFMCKEAPEGMTSEGSDTPFCSKRERIIVHNDEAGEAKSLDPPAQHGLGAPS